MFDDKKIKKVFCLGLVFLCYGVAIAQNRVISYATSSEDFPNPERGFYLASHSKPGDLKEDELIKLRTTNSIKSSNANYATFITLIYKGYLLTEFRDKPIIDDFLNQLQSDFDITRKAGLKMILRFAYTNTSHKGDCPEGQICPPYGDAPKEIVLKHIAQLKPLLQKNADVIAVMQEGFIGIWGENYYTDYFGDASKNDLGYMPDSSWRDRNEVLKALLDALPPDRMVQVRTPRIKQHFVYGVHAPLKPAEAFSQSDKARIAFHNDCFLSSEDDYGTFADYGSSTSPKKPANKILRNYFEQDSKYVAVGGETCDDAFSPQNDCGPKGHAEEEMAAMHYSFLNVSYNNLVNNDWETQGCMTAIKQHLGYRFVLEKAILPVNQQITDSLKIDIQINNQGFASPYNPRKANIILRNTSSKEIYTIALKTNVQKWFSGTTHINENIALPREIKPGQYEMLLHLPDVAKSLNNRPEYSIRFANNQVWESQTGYNSLNHLLKIIK
ncbi:DUF4832 domain-containing protein [Pedobacter sp. SD-b]|uniref:DUF4832 domain-containing protein n=1 Tax=Pedobacter segetis TaxID=2793069 RepID=A0ABS1BLJ0_9SPHI|nr:DUF4832 domain-containing protein [Pedobacter segetis]MBK0383652.1 DUF4832 domain-containing protein [Pedobacter segetis]